MCSLPGMRLANLIFALITVEQALLITFPTSGTEQEVGRRHEAGMALTELL